MKKVVLLVISVILLGFLTGFKPITIKSISNLKASVGQNYKYTLPKTVTTKLSNGLKMKMPIVWTKTNVDTSKLGKFSFYGIVKGFRSYVKLELTVYYVENGTEEVFKDASKLEFTLYYGFRDINTINTTKDVYERMTATGAAISIKLKITDDEMKVIMDSMRKIDLLSYPKDVSEYLAGKISEGEFLNSTSYDLFVSYNGQNRYFSWKDTHLDESPKGENFRFMLGTIIGIVQAHEEYKALPALPLYQ